MFDDSTLENTKEYIRTKVKCWTRGMGYYRPSENFNIGKQSEFKERKFFDESVAMKKVK